MKRVKKSVLLWYSPQQMYDLVTDVDRYPEFLPWCNKAEVLERHADGITARLAMSYMGVRQSFTTRNHQVPGASVLITLVDGPFSTLEGSWQFGAIAVPGQDVPACRIEFDLRYAFAGAALDAVISPVFGRIADTFVDSFVKRAQSVHGVR